MTSSKTIRALAVLSCFAFIAVGCGRDDESGDGGGGGDDTETTAAPDGAKNAAFIDPAADCTDYQPTAGIEGDTITIGTVRPASGPYSIYDTVTKGIEKYFAAANAKGGIKAGDGKTYKVNLLKEDDGYDPGRTPDLVKKLVEQDGVFALVGDIGTETNLAVRQYLNDKCVPNVALATGSTEWGNANQYPWYIAGLPSYALEMRAFLDYLETVQPEAKIGMLLQNDDFGQAYGKAVQKYIDDTGSKMTVVGEESYDPASGGTTEGATVKLASSGADVFIVGIGGTQCSKTLTFIPADWKPLTYVSITCSGKLSLSLAGGKDEGVYTVQATLDPGAPSDQSNPKVQQFFTDGAAQGLTQQDLEGGIVSAGWGFASVFAEGLAQTKEVTRAGIMNALYSLDGVNFGLQRDESEITTDGGDDPWILEGLRVVQRTNGDWTEKTPLKDYNGKSGSFAG
jgi:branched-chain amino acid transport system substrate-binding protein